MLNKSWKTTSAGILAIVGALTSLAYAIKGGEITPNVIMVAATGILTGVGLIYARDNDKTSEQVNAPEAGVSAPNLPTPVVPQSSQAGKP